MHGFVPICIDHPMFVCLYMVSTQKKLILLHFFLTQYILLLDNEKIEYIEKYTNTNISNNFLVINNISHLNDTCRHWGFQQPPCCILHCQDYHNELLSKIQFVLWESQCEIYQMQHWRVTVIMANKIGKVLVIRAKYVYKEHSVVFCWK